MFHTGKSTFVEFAGADTSPLGDPDTPDIVMLKADELFPNGKKQFDQLDGLG